MMIITVQLLSIELSGGRWCSFLITIKGSFSLKVFLDPARDNSSHSFCHINMIITVVDVQLSIEFLEVVLLLDNTIKGIIDNNNCQLIIELSGGSWCSFLITLKGIFAMIITVQ